MKPACEFVSKEILPGIRALIARKMMEDHGLSQTEVASLLDTTQPAISQYKREHRGKKFLILKDDPGVMEKIANLAKKIVMGEIIAKQLGSEFCSICKHMQNNGLIPDKYRCGL
jgi:hypothetical protein